MNLSIGIVGLPNVGKSTLFNILTKQQVLAANYPFATIDPNVGVVPVPDSRVEKLASMSKSAKKIPAIVEFYDIAGLVKGASKGEGLGNQFLAHIRETQAVVIVLRAFNDPSVLHVEGAPDPLRDLEIISMELALKDLETVEKRLTKAESEARTGDKRATELRNVLQSLKSTVEAGTPLVFSSLGAEVLQHPGVKDLNLLTAKRVLFLLNGKEDEVPKPLFDRISQLRASYIVKDLGSAKDVDDLIAASYKILDLISFFTTGEEETRVWTIEQGTKAPQAAGVIHTDFEKKFIRAEVVGAEELLTAGSWATAKAKGKLRLEGKEYVVQDGDVMVIRHG